MPSRNESKTGTQRSQEGYTPKGYVTTVINGKTMNIPVSELKINPPKSGTAVVTPKK
jgi:outer membrane lipoprotein-sorting protein